jgi:hypothetical protein
MQSYCDSTDPYCCDGSDAATHNGYGTEYGADALTFIKGKLDSAASSGAATTQSSAAANGTTSATDASASGNTASVPITGDGQTTGTDAAAGSSSSSSAAVPAAERARPLARRRVRRLVRRLVPTSRDRLRAVTTSGVRLKVSRRVKAGGVVGA